MQMVKKRQILFEYPNIQPNNAILDELNSFAHAINENREVEVSLEDGTEALKVALEIMKLICSNLFWMMEAGSWKSYK